MRIRKAVVATLACLIASSAAAASGQTAARSTRRPFADKDAPKRLERIRTYDVLHVKADVAIDPKAGEVRGTVTHSMAPLHPSLTTVTLDCGRELKVSRVTAGSSGKAAACTFERKGDTLVVTLDRPYARGETLDLSVTYAGSPEQGLYFITPDPSVPGRPLCVWSQGEAEETHHWLPCYDFPNDRATSELTVTVPKPLTVLSNGELVETRDNPDGTATFHWRTATPHVSYLISLVASEFNVVKDRAGDLPVEYWVLKNVDAATARRGLGKTPRMVGFYEAKTGQTYPYAKYAQAVVPEFTQGGMENISATTLNEYALLDEVEALERDADSLVAHELSHQWFGDLLTCKDWPHLWLNEGFASYFDPLWVEHDRGEDAFRLTMQEVQGAYKGGDTFVRRALVEPRYKSTNDLFDSVTYSKGASVLHALRGLIGDEAWWAGIKKYVAENREKVVETDDFRKAMEAASGRDLGWFFDQWVFKAGHPELKATWRFEPEDRTVRLKVEQTQTVDDQTPLFRLPTTVEIDDGAATRSVPVVVDGKTHEFVIPSPAPPKTVRLDPKGWLLKTLDFTKAPEEWAYQLGHAADALGRVEAARAIARKKDDPKAVERLTAAWKAERVPGAKVTLTTLLGGFAEKARPVLLDAAKDADAKVRAQAFSALAGVTIDAPTESLFRSALSDPKEAYGVRRAALRGLAKAKVKGVDDLVSRTMADPSGDYKLAASALALRLEDKAKAREAAVNYSRPGQPLALRRAATSALARLAKDDPEVTAALLDLVDDPSRPVRTSVWRLIGSGDLPGSREALEAQLKRETHATTRPAIVGIVAALKKPAGGETAATTKAAPRPPENLERQAAELELQLRELRNRIEAVKIREARGRFAAPGTAPSTAAGKS